VKLKKGRGKMWGENAGESALRNGKGNMQNWLGSEAQLIN